MKKNIFIIFFLCFSQLYAQKISFNITKPKEVKLAESFYLEYSLTNPDNVSIFISTQTLENSDFHLVKIIKEKKNENDVFKLELIPFNIGISTVPALEFVFSGKNISYTANSPEIPIEVKPLFDIKELKIKDIYPPFQFIDWLKILALLLIIFLIAYLIYRKIKKDMANKPEIFSSSQIENKTPYQAAMDEISKLLNSDLLSRGEFKLFYSQLSDILRIYLEREFSIQAMYMTTKDIMKNISNIITEIKDVLQLREFLDRCDAVKFAKYIPEQKEIQEDIEKLKHLLNAFDRISNLRKQASEKTDKEKIDKDKENVF